MSGLTPFFQRSAVSIPYGGVHIWTWIADKAERPEGQLMDLLSCKEREQAARFRFLRHQNSYTVAHINMRVILSRYLLQAPEEICFTNDQLGKPRVRLDDRRMIYFSLSHAGAFGILAVANGYDVGIDAESVRPVNMEVASTCFSPYELRQLEGLRGPSWVQSFYRCWTCKEAVLKAEGVGLTVPLDAFDVDFVVGRRPSVVACRLPKQSLLRWQLFALDLAPGIVASLAVSESPTSLSLFSLQA